MSDEARFVRSRSPVTVAYLAGLLEGEGSFLKGPPSGPEQATIALEMTDEDVVARAALLMETSYFRIEPREAHHKVSFACRIRGERAVELAFALRPLLGARRRHQIDVALAARPRKCRHRLYDTEVAELLDGRQQGAGRRELAKRFDIGPKTVNKIVAGGTRDLVATKCEHLRFGMLNVNCLRRRAAMSSRRGWRRS